MEEGESRFSPTYLGYKAILKTTVYFSFLILFVNLGFLATIFFVLDVKISPQITDFMLMMGLLAILIGTVIFSFSSAWIIHDRTWKGAVLLGALYVILFSIFFISADNEGRGWLVFGFPGLVFHGLIWTFILIGLRRFYRLEKNRTKMLILVLPFVIMSAYIILILLSFNSHITQFCSFLPQGPRLECIQRAAVSNDDLSLCDKAIGFETKCHVGVYVHLLEKGNSCQELQYPKEFYRSECIIAQAQIEKNPSLCNALENQEYYQNLCNLSSSGVIVYG